MRLRASTTRTALESEWQKRLHSTPLLQCRCGEVLRSAHCACSDPTATHAPETVQGSCGVCHLAQKER
jgi:hypothetical protein